MKKFSRLLLGAGMLSATVCIPAHTQNSIFDPLLDPVCKIASPEPAETWSTAYMWYPGQLSAYLQRVQKNKSDERCVNVDYPGNFTKPHDRAVFRKEIKLPEKTEISWKATGEVLFTIDGKAQQPELTACTLTPGTHTLRFDVRTSGRLPALIIQGNKVQETEGWQVTLDERTWNLPETDARYNKPSLPPDGEQEITVTIPPDRYIFLRNAAETDGRLELGENACLLVDFRHLEIGNIVVEAAGSGTVSFSMGESTDEALNEDTRGFEQKPLKPVALTATPQAITLPERALRYLKISCDRPCTINSVRFEANIWPVEFLMQFECDNKSLNDLWNAGIATLHTSLHNFYLDGVKRDFLPWSMDAVISSLGGDYVFGDPQVSRNGISVSLMPPDPQAADWGIVDYPLHTLIGLKHDYLRYGDLRTSLLFKDRILQQFDLYESVQDVNGFIPAERPTWGFIPGWARKMGPDDYGKATYAQMMLYQNFLTGAYFARLWEEDSLAAHYEEKASQLEKSIRSHFWDDERKAFINGYRTDGTKDYRISHHAQYWGVLTGLYPEKHYNYLFDKILPAIPFYKEIVSYEKGYEYLAYIRAGRVKDMFTRLGEAWTDWLDQGHTRFPENFSPKAPLKQQLTFYDRPFGLSLCHGTNGVPPIIAVLYGIYGFSQSDKDISEYTLRPELLQLNWVKGRIPVKEGFIDIHWVKDGTCSVRIPAGCTVRLYPGSQEKPMEWKKAGTYTFRIKP